MLYVIAYIWANINDKYKLSSYTTNIRYCTILVFLTSYFFKKNPIAFSKYVQKSSASQRRAHYYHRMCVSFSLHLGEELLRNFCRQQVASLTEICSFYLLMR